MPLADRPLPSLTVDRTYSWAQLAELFDFQPEYLGAVGGMASRPDFNALLLITHPGGGKSFDYEDYWDGADLIYTGRGKNGDQSLNGPNGDVAANAKHLLVFENVGSRQLRFLGEADCTQHWPARGPGDDGAERTIIRFRLSFSAARPVPTSATEPAPQRTPAARRGRPFDHAAPPPPLSQGSERRTPEETLAAQEKANAAHHQLLVALHAHLVDQRWTAIEEVPYAIDLRATHPGGSKVIFEAKTISDGTEMHQCRAALAQLLEYRFFYGSPDDALCLVVNRPISDARVRFLESEGVAAAVLHERGVLPAGGLGRTLLAPTTARE